MASPIFFYPREVRGHKKLLWRSDVGLGSQCNRIGAGEWRGGEQSLQLPGEGLLGARLELAWDVLLHTDALDLFVALSTDTTVTALGVLTSLVLSRTYLCVTLVHILRKGEEGSELRLPGSHMQHS